MADEPFPEDSAVSEYLRSLECHRDPQVRCRLPVGHAGECDPNPGADA